ncbi:MAG TPA: YceD family protein [Actinomycetota bacterium]|nr:YceD family protein [Actinomycetota bacterium]
MTLGPLDVRELIGTPGATRRVALRGNLEGLGTELARVPDDAPLSADLLLESVVEGIVVSGVVRGTLALRCARCLKAFDGSFTVDVEELFAADAAADDDAYPLDRAGELDPEQMVRDAIGVELPFSPLCRPDCQGLCEICGGDRNLGECPGHAAVDPRFAVLSELIPELPESD